MSDLIKKEQALAIEFGNTVGTELANDYSDVVQLFFPYYVIAKSHEENARAIEQAFNDAESDDEKLKLASDAKKIRLAVAKVRGSKGIAPIKTTEKAGIIKAGKAVDGSHNAVLNFAKELESKMLPIEEYALVIAQRIADQLAQDRKDEIECIGGADFLGTYGDLALYTPENFDNVLSQIHSLVEAKKNADRLAILEAEALKVKQDAERLAEAKELAKEELAKAEAKAKQDAKELAEAKAKAEADKIEADAKEAQAVIDRATAKAEKAIADEALRLANIEAARLQAIQDKADAKAKLEAKQSEALLQGDDRGKVEKLGKEARAFNDLLDSLDFKSEEGKALYSKLSPILAGVITDLLRTYKAL